MLYRLKKYFFSGLAVFLPFGLTIYVCVWALNFAENIFGRHLRAFFLNNYDFYFWGIGLFVLLSLILFCGFLITNYFGRGIHRFVESLMMRIPLMANLYPAFKEIAGFLFREQSSKLEQVVLIEWPRKGCHTVGFLTNKTPQRICDAAGRELVNVLVPTVPNPLTGFIAMVPREELVLLKMSVEEAIRIVVSGGVVDPFTMPSDETAPHH